MLRRFFRKPLVKIMLLLEFTVALTVLSNLWSFTESSLDLGSAGGYSGCDAVFWVSINRDDGNENGDTNEKEERRKEYARVKIMLRGFLEKVAGLGGNISVYPLAGDIGEGDRVLYTLFLSAEEEPDVPTESVKRGFTEVPGAYVGNQNVNYIGDDGYLNAFSDRLEVTGIMVAYGFEKNNDVYVKYDELSEMSKAESIDAIMSNAYTGHSEYDDPVCIRLQSDRIEEAEYAQRLSEIAEGYSELSVERGMEETEEIVYSYEIYENIKYVFMALAALLTAVLMFQTIVLFLYGESNDIFVMKTCGMGGVRIFARLYAAVCAVLGASAVLTLAVEAVAYHFARGYTAVSIFRNMAPAFAGVLALITVFLAAGYARLIRKPLAAGLAAEE